MRTNTANKKLDIEKENNVKLNKRFKDQKNESEKQISTLKTINLDLENMNNEPTTCKENQQHQQQSNRGVSEKRNTRKT